MTSRYELNFPTDNPLDPQHHETIDLLVMNLPGTLQYIHNCADFIRKADSKDVPGLADAFDRLIKALMQAFGRHASRREVPMPALEAFTDLLAAGMAVHRHVQHIPTDRGNPTIEIEPGDFNFSMN